MMVFILYDRRGVCVYWGLEADADVGGEVFY
jgi:hypothetical protein